MKLNNKNILVYIVIVLEICLLLTYIFYRNANLKKISDYGYKIGNLKNDYNLACSTGEIEKARILMKELLIIYKKGPLEVIIPENFNELSCSELNELSDRWFTNAFSYTSKISSKIMILRNIFGTIGFFVFIIFLILFLLKKLNLSKPTGTGTN